jgi:hypothetical protein
MNYTRFTQIRGARWLLLACCIGTVGLMFSPVVGRTSVYAAAACDHVRWDIIHLDFTATPATANPGGTAIASADVTTNQITFTDSSGTFVAPPSGGISHAVTGGGKWTTSDGMTTKSGTYTVTALVSWQFVNFQLPGPTDLIDPDDPRANGTAILKIQYDDGSEGILGIGCHGPGAPPGIQEGVIATKGYVTYWLGAAHGPGVDINFTVFHILK